MHEANGVAIKKILARAADFIRPPLTADDFLVDQSQRTSVVAPEVARSRQIIAQLSAQIEAMWADGSYMRAGKEPYKMVSRLAAHSWLIGDVPLWNCKSGKDRTGFLDAAIKFLLLRVERDGVVPEPDAELSEEDRILLRDCVLKTGNLEIQEMSTGFPGYKTEGVAANDAALGSDAAIVERRGLSPLTGS